MLRSEKTIVTYALLAGMFLAGGCKKKQEIPYPDLSTPRAAAVTFVRAMENDDVKTAQDAAVAGGMEVDFVDATAHYTYAVKQLLKRTRAKFGEEAKDVFPATDVDVSILLISGEVTVDGDERATVTPQDGRTSIPVQRTEEGTWKVDVGVLIKGADVTQAIPALLIGAAAARDISAQLDAGKFAKAPEVKVALQARVNELGAERGAATTLPTSLPAGGGGV
jgi:hypothetical protein